MTVVTQFISSDGTDNGDLVEIRRFYVQDGKQINTTAWQGFDSITDNYVNKAKTYFNDTKSFEPRGGLKRLGDVMKSNGMVLVMSLWDDSYAQMAWLDGTQPAGSTAVGAKRGPCADGSGDPSTLEKNVPNSKVVYSDIRYGDIGSTTSGSGPSPGPSPSPPSPSPPSPSPSGCPGGSLSACIGLCPSSPASCIFL